MPERISITGERDPNESAKDRAEREVEEFFAEQLSLQYQDLSARLDTEQPQQPDDKWWQGWAAIFLAFVATNFAGYAEESAQTAIELFGIGVEWDEVVSESANWASTYGFNLVTNINENSRVALQRALNNYYSSEVQDRELLIQAMKPMFSDVRANMIAITESSRGFERGLSIYEEKLNAQGIQTDRLWHTMEDERVCIICEPNNNVLRSEGWTVAEVPAHPRDRCWTEIVLVQ